MCQTSKERNTHETKLDREVYTLEQVCELLQCSKQLLYDEIKKKRLKAFKAGNAYRVTREALLDYMREPEPNKKRAHEDYIKARCARCVDRERTPEERGGDSLTAHPNTERIIRTEIAV